MSDLTENVLIDVYMDLSRLKVKMTEDGAHELSVIMRLLLNAMSATERAIVDSLSHGRSDQTAAPYEAPREGVGWSMSMPPDLTAAGIRFPELEKHPEYEYITRLRSCLVYWFESLCNKVRIDHNLP